MHHSHTPTSITSATGGHRAHIATMIRTYAVNIGPRPPERPHQLMAPIRGATRERIEPAGFETPLARAVTSALIQGPQY